MTEKFKLTKPQQDTYDKLSKYDKSVPPNDITRLINAYGKHSKEPNTQSKFDKILDNIIDVVAFQNPKKSKSDVIKSIIKRVKPVNSQSLFNTIFW